MLITDDYRRQNAELHRKGRFGGSGHKNAAAVRAFARDLGCSTILDYGCGQGTLKDALPEFQIAEYDPAIEAISADPEPADLVVCTDVMEHVEPQCLDDVLAHIASKARRGAYFAIALRLDSKKTLPDGRNPHLIVESAEWWRDRIGRRLEVRGSKEIHGKEVVLWTVPR